MHPFQDASVELMERPLSSPKKLPLPSSGATRSRCQAQGVSARINIRGQLAAIFIYLLFSIRSSINSYIAADRLIFDIVQRRGRSKIFRR